MKEFIKMNACENDFVVFDCEDFQESENVKSQAQKLCNRRTGIGADGVICIIPVEGGGVNYRMRIFNADGSEAEMCGNGIRCVGEYLRVTNKHDFNAEWQFAVDTLAGIIVVEYTGLCDDGGGGNYRVNMGAPRFAPDDIPVVPLEVDDTDFIMQELTAREKVFKVTAVSMGNPHAVIYADELDDELVLGYGPAIQTHRLFPRGVNVEFVKIVAPDEIRMRVYERGCGETPACGTGACAAVASGVINKLHDGNVTVHLLGGKLFIEWNGKLDSPIYMSGAAQAVFSGTLHT